jgi:hypothetical protein
MFSLGKRRYKNFMSGKIKFLFPFKQFVPAPEEILNHNNPQTM